MRIFRDCKGIPRKVLSLLLAIFLTSAALLLPGCGGDSSGNTADSSEIDSSGSDADSSEVDSSGGDTAGSGVDSSGSDAGSSEVDSSGGDTADSEVDSSGGDTAGSEVDSSDSDPNVISSVLIDDGVTSVEITVSDDAVRRHRTVTGEDVSLLRDWANHLEYSKVPEEWQDNAYFSEGGKMFRFRLERTTGNTDWFFYLIHKVGIMYLSIDDKWYAVMNPSDPPVPVPEKPATEISSTLIGDEVIGIEIAFYNGGGGTSRTATEEEIARLRDWANHLKYITITEEEQWRALPPGTNSFHFTVYGEKTTKFTYFGSEYAHLRIGDEIYAVTNSSDPPVTVPNRS